MNLLYVCLGNRFRSLLAEAYTRKNHDAEVRSRGTEATGPIHDEVKEILREEDLVEYSSMNPTQISQEDIEWADRIVFMSEENRKFTEENHDLDDKSLEVWNVPDADPGDPLKTIYGDIESKVEEMME